MTEVTMPDLGPRGSAFWTSTLGRYALTDSELTILTEACRTIDALDALDRMITTVGPTTIGASGQTVVNPALTEARGQRLVLHRLIAALNLPDADGATVPNGHGIRGRTAATAKWAQQRRAASRVG